ncbi:unnamed protein product [Spirodela intermedia]|uniref:Uncharacterized protein n=1 Tax=Spirodela intermedia TaxID=51605 RepID=A0A7I8J5E9_SPIIN|nr:unnamed protein product [Spirodela intermedia]CAA6665456.1 unnamed protein product [Spirodela intermedia]
MGGESGRQNVSRIPPHKWSATGRIARRRCKRAAVSHSD